MRKQGGGGGETGKTGGRYEFGLEQFANQGFKVGGFVNNVCARTAEVDGKVGFGRDMAGFDMLLDDLGPLEADLRDALTQVEGMEMAVGKRIESIKDENTKLSNELVELSRKHAQQQEDMAKDFRTLERKFGHSSGTAIGIGSRLHHLDEIKSRALHARSLLQYFNEFAYDLELTSPIFVNFPRTLADAAPIIADLFNVTNGLSLPEASQGIKKIGEMNEKVLNGLLDEFEMANTDGDLIKMRDCADAILDNFDQKESLFQRFVFYSLNELVAARKRSISFKNSALKDNLAHLFSQIKSVVQKANIITNRVFPRHAEEIISLLVSRLFNDSVFGLHPILYEFLNPTHRQQQLPHNEYLSILYTAHKETESLVKELVHGLKTQRGLLGTNRAGQPLKPLDQFLQNNRNAANGETKKADRKSRLGKRRSSITMGSTLSNRTTMHFDAGFIYKQFKGVFQQFTVDYGVREMSLFEQRISKRLFTTLPLEVVAISSPDLKPPPDFVSRVNAWKGETTEEVYTQVLTLYETDPITVLNKLIADKEINVASVASRTLQLRTNWRDDMNKINLETLASYCNNGDWQLDVFMNRFAQNSNGDTGDETGETSTLEKPSTTISDRTFSDCLYSLRGVPGQALRWAQEAHLRCLELLGNQAMRRIQLQQSGDGVSRPGTEVYVVENMESNMACFQTIEDLFQNFCDRLFQSTLIPLVRLLRGNLPKARPTKLGEAGSLLKQFMDDASDLIQNDGSTEDISYVIGCTPLSPQPRSLPTLAVGNAAIKNMSTQIGKIAQTRADFGGALVPASLDLVVASTHAIDDTVEQVLLYWRDVVYASLGDNRNVTTSCQSFLESRLSKLEEELSNTYEQHLLSVQLQMQAVVCALHDKAEYNPRDDAALELGKNSQWCEICCQILQVELDVLSLIGDATLRDYVLVSLSYIARDNLLGTIKRSKVSPQGALKLVQDITAFTKLILRNPFAANLEAVNDTWETIRLISQLFLVPPENLESLIKDPEQGLDTLPRRFIYECLSCRVDFRTSFGGRAAWVRPIFTT